MDFDPERDYPLGTKRPDLVTTPSGIPLADVTVEALRARRISAEDMRATAKTLGRQSDVALAAGRPQLAANLQRAAELASVPSEVILEIYTALRPHRSTVAELGEWADRLQSSYGAELTAAFVRQAGAVYAARGLLAAGPSE